MDTQKTDNFTVKEIIIASLIILTLGALAVPHSRDTIETMRAEEAVEIMTTIIRKILVYSYDNQKNAPESLTGLIDRLPQLETFDVPAYQTKMIEDKRVGFVEIKRKSGLYRLTYNNKDVEEIFCYYKPGVKTCKKLGPLVTAVEEN